MHPLDDGVRARAVVESDGVANLLTHAAAELLGDALTDGHRRAAAGLRAADAAASRDAELGEVLLICVVFPEPVSPITTSTLLWLARRAVLEAKYRRLSRCSRIDFFD